MHRLAATAAAVLVGALVTACGAAPNSIAGQARSGDAKGYIAGDGSVQIIAPARRRGPLSLSGTTLSGKPWALTSARSRVVVLNVWGSWCGPCVAEAPQLEKAWLSLSKSKAPVDFMGLDFKEDPAAGASFVRKYGVTYPSLRYDGGRPVLALQGQAPAVPTTLIVDRQGRIAARVLGQTTAATVTGLVTQVLAEVR